MRRVSILAALLLPLAGCYVPPDGDGAYGYAQPYAPAGYSGYQYNDGSPYMSYEGAEVPLLFFGGYWGFYDREHRFHRAPDSVGRRLEERNPQGHGGRPPTAGGGYRQPEPRPQFRQSPVAPAYTAPPVRRAPPPVRTAAPPAPPAPRPAERREERREHHCPQGQTHC